MGQVRGNFKKVVFLHAKERDMGQLAFLRMFILVAISIDARSTLVASLVEERTGDQGVQRRENRINRYREIKDIGEQIMCKMKDVSVGIKDMDFKTYRGKMVVRLTDGRTVVVPVSFFPDIKQMPVKEREKWMVLDDQYFTFENMTRVYSVLDLLKAA